MAASGASGKDKIGVLFVHTATRPLLRADTRGQTQHMPVSERSAFEVHAACATAPENRPRSTYDVLREIPDLRGVPLDLGLEVSLDSSALGKLRALLVTVPAPAGMVHLGPYVRRNGIELIGTSDPPTPRSPAGGTTCPE